MSQPTIPDVPGTPASSGVAAAPASPRAAGPEHACANCGAALLGPYCAQCGQKAAHRIVSLKRILEDALEDQLSLTAALPRTIGVLLRHPGRLTREYIAGRVASYIPPMRLYLIASVLFFLVMAALPDSTQFQVQGPHATTPGASAPASAPVMLRLDTTGVGGWRGRFLHRLGQQIARVSQMQQRDASRVLTQKFADVAPKVLFAMVPVFALLLKLLYVRRRRLYVEHFVFALHVHALAFFVLAPLLIAQSAARGTGAEGVVRVTQFLLTLAIGAYLLVAMRVVYEQGRGRTLLKWGLLGFSYMVVIALGMGTVVMIALFQV